MPSQKNIDAVADLTTKLSEAKSVVIANYSGLSVKDQNDLRAKIAQAGGQFIVAKNRLMGLAIKNKLGDLSSQIQDTLNDQNAFLFSQQDAVSALKALVEFSKDNENLEIKLGLLDDKVLSVDEVIDLSKLPSKIELIGQLIARLNGPAYGLVNVISGPTRKLVYALEAVKKSKEEKTN